MALAFAVAASANLPTILYSLYWQRFNTRGALWSMYGGLVSAIVLIVLSPVVSGAKTAMCRTSTSRSSRWPTRASCRSRSRSSWAGSVDLTRARDTAKQAEMEVRSLTGVGAEKATHH